MTARQRIVRLVNHGVAIPDTSRSPDTARVPALVLAPMATITHAGFRTLVSEFGDCDLYFTEMISAEALVGGTQFEQSYLDLAPDPSRTIYQLVGYTTGSLLAAAERLLAHPCAGVDINMGCSAPHIVRKGGGISWMSRARESAELISRLRKLTDDRSVSVKLRLGRDDDAAGLAVFARQLQDSGIDFLTQHPKRQKDGSNRPARWQFIRQLASALDVPVVGNGGITTWDSYRACRRIAGDSGAGNAGAVMIGRGAVKAPWIFRTLRAYERGEAGFTVDLLAVANRFFDLLEQHQPQEFWASRSRRVAPYLLSNLPFAHSLGAKLGASRDYEETRRVMRSYLSDPGRRFMHISPKN